MVTKYLMHITTEENATNIKNTNNFIASVHNKNSIQWLGDGVYFWDANDDDAEKIGISLVKNKEENKDKNLAKIILKMSTDKEKYLNLDDKEWIEKFKMFLNNKEFENGKNIFILFDSLLKKRTIKSKDLNKVWKVMGDAINLFIKVLEDEYNQKIDIISYYFFQFRKETIFLPKKEIYIRQYCVKNMLLLNSIKSDNWEIELIN